jgi:hypothetical protein
VKRHAAFSPDFECAKTFFSAFRVFDFLLLKLKA